MSPDNPWRDIVPQGEDLAKIKQKSLDELLGDIAEWGHSVAYWRLKLAETETEADRADIKSHLFSAEWVLETTKAQVRALVGGQQ